MSGECTEGGESSNCGRAATDSADCSAVEDTGPSVIDDCNLGQAAHPYVSGETGSCCQLSAARTGE